jgi:type II secretory pathway component PulF
MKYLKKKVILKYLYNQLTGNFMGFLIGMSATGLVSQFFETRSFRNFWGLASKKTVIDKETFSNLEWIISIVVGFIVFEVMTKVVKEKLDRNLPTIKRKFFRFLVEKQLHNSIRQHYQTFHSQSVQFISAMNLGMRHAINKYSKR